MSSRGGKRGNKAQYYKNLAKASKENEQAIKGPGIFVTTPRRKEHKAVFESYDLLNSLADRLYPSVATETLDDDEEQDIEAMIAREVSEVKKTRAEGGQRFQSRKTHTDCLVFISCAAPLDPIRLVEGAVSDLIQTKQPTTQQVNRLTPVSATTSAANLESVEALFLKQLTPIFGPHENEPTPRPLTYKIEIISRSHTVLKRDNLIQSIGTMINSLAAACNRPVKADLTNPDVVVIVSLFKSTCGLAVVEGKLYEESKHYSLAGVGEQVIQQPQVQDVEMS